MTILNRKNQKEAGSIMLEVVAVLALMGVMGAMLFRQIYQRNQELHNIQMASEIRTVKEAFSAYIQANRPAVLDWCKSENLNQDGGCGVESEAIANAVTEYLPEGWFNDDLDDAYSFSLWTYIQSDASARQIVYGVVTPTDGTLPSTGWNFKRAARVALLIGADGGVYGPGITECSKAEYGKTCIAGALGAWELPADGIITGNETPTYVAMTALDIFTPESLAPDVKVNLPEDWKLVLKELHAYDYFSVGGGADNNCYTVQHTVATEGDIKSDDIHTSNSACSPLFWVGKSGKTSDEKVGNVYVATDLNVGRLSGSEHDKALQLTAEGVIRQKDGLTIDREGRIIAKETVSADIGELKSGENYVLDPAYTSTMNDIRLASRGGARLSDILPNYILKDTYTGSCKLGTSRLDAFKTGTTTPAVTPSWCDVKWQELSEMKYQSSQAKGTEISYVPRPKCPTGYKEAFVIIPSYFGNSGSKITKTKHKHTDSSSGETNGAIADLNGDNDVNDLNEKDAPFVSDIETEHCRFFVNVTNLNSGASHYKDSFWKAGAGAPHLQKESSTADSETMVVVAGYYAGRSNPEVDGNTSGYTRMYVCETAKAEEEIKLVLQTYCVWTPSLLASKEACEAAGYVWSASKCTATRREAAAGDGTNVKSNERNQDACKAAGLTWENNRCVAKYTNIGSITDVVKKAAACKAAGGTWKWDNDARTAGTCSGI